MGNKLKTRDVLEKVFDTSLKSSKTIKVLVTEIESVTKVVYAMTTAIKNLTEMILEHHEVITQFKALNEMMSKQLAKSNTDTYGFPSLNNTKEEKPN